MIGWLCEAGCFSPLRTTMICAAGFLLVTEALFFFSAPAWAPVAAAVVFGTLAVVCWYACIKARG